MDNTIETINEYIDIFYNNEEEDAENFEFTLGDVRYCMKMFASKAIMEFRKEVGSNDKVIEVSDYLLKSLK